MLRQDDASLCFNGGGESGHLMGRALSSEPALGELSNRIPLDGDASHTHSSKPRSKAAVELAPLTAPADDILANLHLPTRGPSSTPAHPPVAIATAERGGQLQPAGPLKMPHEFARGKGPRRLPSPKGGRVAKLDAFYTGDLNSGAHREDGPASHEADIDEAKDERGLEVVAVAGASNRAESAATAAGVRAASAVGSPPMAGDGSPRWESADECEDEERGLLQPNRAGGCEAQGGKGKWHHQGGEARTRNGECGLRSESQSQRAKLLLRMCLVTFTGFMAIVFPDLQRMVGVCGAIAGSLLAVIIPALVSLQCRPKGGTSLSRAVDVLLVGFGLFFGALGSITALSID